MKATHLFFRSLTVFGLALALLIPLFMIQSAVHDRVQYRDEAVARVSSSTAGPQQLVGPVRVVVYTDSREAQSVDVNGVPVTRVETTQGHLLQAPRSLRVNGELVPDTRRIGLYDVRVFQWNARVESRFDELKLPEVDGREYEEAYVVVGLGDVRGLVGTPSLTVDGGDVALEPGTQRLARRMDGVHAPLEKSEGALAKSEIALEVSLLGTQTLGVAPVADENEIAVSSAWPHPLFGGSFLPNHREIGGEGFEARWSISSLASSARDALFSEGDGASLTKRWPSEGPAIESVDVSLVDPVDVYTQTDRASKYGFLFVLLTFVAFALFELLKRWPIHPVQYLLVGLALAIFFLLLLGLSEHIPFAAAYLVAAASCIGLQFAYLVGVLASRVRSAGFSAMLTALYGVLYAILLSEDNALLMGSLLLFGILASIMWITRKLDWYSLGAPAAVD